MSYQQENSKALWQQCVVRNDFKQVPVELDRHLQESWQRCLRRQRYDHWPPMSYAKGVTLASIKKSKSRLMDVAIPVLEDIHEFLEHNSCALLLTDETGCMLGLKASHDMQTELEHLGIAEGVYWREGIMGNTAISSAMSQAKVTGTVGFEHFKQALHGLACYAAPLFDSQGHILGAIGLVLPVTQASNFVQGLVYSASKEIDTNLYADYCLTESNQHLSEVYVLLEGVEEGVLAWDVHGIIHYLNSKGSHLLHLPSNKALGCNIDDMIQLPQRVKLAIENKQDLAMFETTVEVEQGQKLISLLMSLRLVKDEQHQVHSYMVLMHPIEHIRQLVHHHAGNQAHLTFDDIVFRSEGMQRVIRLAQHAAKGSGSIFLHGEEGLGKADLAQALHNASERRDKAFISINCQAIPKVSMTTEFLGSTQDSENPFPSKFELANGGTLFLEHVECLTTEVQAALLHLLKTGLINRLNHTIVPVDVRIIATSDIDLEQYVDEQRFGRQLMYELQSFDIFVPPLRDRLEDIPVLAERYLKFLSGDTGKSVSLAADAMQALSKYHWPGNNLELRNVLERAASYNDGKRLTLDDLPDSVTAVETLEEAGVATLVEIEKNAIVRSALRCQGKPSKMCAELGVSRTSLWRKLKAYTIDLDTFKHH